MPRMGGIRLAASLASAGLVLCACGGSAQAAVHEDTLVLEVGGASSSLREALAARGIVIAPQPDKPERQSRSMAAKSSPGVPASK